MGRGVVVVVSSRSPRAPSSAPFFLFGHFPSSIKQQRGAFCCVDGGGLDRWVDKLVVAAADGFSLFGWGFASKSTQINSEHRRGADLRSRLGDPTSASLPSASRSVMPPQLLSIVVVTASTASSIGGTVMLFGRFVSHTVLCSIRHRSPYCGTTAMIPFTCTTTAHRGAFEMLPCDLAH